MINSASKLSSHFIPLETRLSDSNATLFTVLLFAKERSNNLRSWESLEEQTLKNWDLIIVNPPNGNNAIFDLISLKKSTERVILSADFSSVVKILETRTSHYISFIDQNTSWMSDKLSHEYAIFNSSSAVMLFSAPLLISSQPDDNARIPRYRLKPNQLLSNEMLSRALVETVIGEKFFIDSVSVRRKELIGYFDGRSPSFRPAITKIAGNEHVFFSDKCLVEVHVPQEMDLHGLEKMITDTSDFNADAGAPTLWKNLLRQVVGHRSKPSGRSGS